MINPIVRYCVVPMLEQQELTAAGKAFPPAVQDLVQDSGTGAEAQMQGEIASTMKDQDQVWGPAMMQRSEINTEERHKPSPFVAVEELKQQNWWMEGLHPLLGPGA